MQAPSEGLFLAQIVLLLLVGRLLGEAMQRIGQPAVMGQMIAGILLGPSVFGAIWPEAQRVVCYLAAWYFDAVAADGDGNRPPVGKEGASGRHSHKVAASATGVCARLAHHSATKQ